MPIQVRIGPEATVELNARRTLEGDLMIFDHDQIDIVVMTERNKVVTFPKDNITEDVYPTQSRFFDLLVRRGVVNNQSVQGGNVFNSLEAEIPNSKFANPLQAVVYVISEFIDTEERIKQRADEYEAEIEKFYLEPDDAHSTELGEVPQDPEKGSIRPGYYYTPLRYRY
tara:strand:- start:326 stop:832 length:507 start_codon:yes stop_codon:yes gene_type:complete